MTGPLIAQVSNPLDDLGISDELARRDPGTGGDTPTFGLGEIAEREPLPIGIAEGDVARPSILDNAPGTRDPQGTPAARLAATQVPLSQLPFQAESVTEVFRVLSPEQIWGLQLQLVQAGALDPDQALDERGQWIVGGGTQSGLELVMSWANRATASETNRLGEQTFEPFGLGGSNEVLKPRVGVALPQTRTMRTLQKALNARIDSVEAVQTRFANQAMNIELPSASELLPSAESVAKDAREIWKRKLGREPRADELAQAAAFLSREHAIAQRNVVRDLYERAIQAREYAQASLVDKAGLPSTLKSAELAQTIPGIKTPLPQPGQIRAGDLSVSDVTEQGSSPYDRLDDFIGQIRAGEIAFNEYTGNGADERRGNVYANVRNMPS